MFLRIVRNRFVIFERSFDRHRVVRSLIRYDVDVYSLI